MLPGVAQEEPRARFNLTTNELVQFRVIVQTLQEEHQRPMPPSLEHVPNLSNREPVLIRVRKKNPGPFGCRDGSRVHSASLPSVQTVSAWHFCASDSFPALRVVRPDLAKIRGAMLWAGAPGPWLLMQVAP